MQLDTKLLAWYTDNSNLFTEQRSEWSWLTRAMTNQNCFMLDIGGNVGIYAHGLLKKFPDVLVLSFEPIPHYAQFIRDHPSSSTNRIKVESLAMGREPWPTNVSLLMDSRNLGWNTLHTDNNVIECADCMQTIQITSVSFDYYYLSHPELASMRCSFIKIDTEGFEARVLQGMHVFLTHRAKELPLMVIEVAWGPNKHPHWGEAVAEFEWLISLGYQRAQYEFSSTQDVWFVPLHKWA
jgi:FkbM family methyltransferase